MRSVNSNTSDYLEAREGVISRTFLYIYAKNRNTDEVEEVGFWNGHEPITVTVVSGQTGANVSRNYYGAGSLVDVSDIPLVSNLTIQNIEITLQQVNQDVLNAVRGYDVRGAPIEVHYGLYNINTRELIDVPYVNFSGKVNKSELPTPPLTEESIITLRCVGKSRELTNVNARKKSNETLKLRNPVDTFRKYTGVVGNWEIRWGEK